MTQNQENVVDLQWLETGEMPPEDLDSLSRNLAFHLKRLVDERDTQLEVIAYLLSRFMFLQGYIPEMLFLTGLCGNFSFFCCSHKRAAAGRKG